MNRGNLKYSFFFDSLHKMSHFGSTPPNFSVNNDRVLDHLRVRQPNTFKLPPATPNLIDPNVENKGDNNPVTNSSLRSGVAQAGALVYCTTPIVNPLNNPPTDGCFDNRNHLYFSDGDQWIPLANCLPSSEPSSGGSGSTIINNVYNVDGVYGSDTNDGLNNPVKTIQKALNLIGSAETTVEWELDSKREHIIKIAIGVYVENLEIPLRPWLLFEMTGATIDGNITWTIPDGIISTTYVIDPQIIFQSTGLREYWPAPGHVHHGITGSIEMTSFHTSGLFFPQINIIESGVGGDISMEGPMSGGQIRLFYSYVGGKLIGPPIPGPSYVATVWARGALNNPDFGDTLGIGGASGRLNFGMLDNVLITGEIDNTQILPGRWYNTRFLPVTTYNFSNYSGLIKMDNATIGNYYENVPSGGRGNVVIGNLIGEMDSIPQPISTQNPPANTTYQIQQSDIDHQISMNFTVPNTVKIPDDGTTFIPINHKIEIIQLGPPPGGTTTIEADTNVTLNGSLAGSIVISGQYHNAFVKKIAPNVWIGYGNVS